MMLLVKCVVVLILFIPALLLTAMVWVFGGWSQGFDYMPNPVYALIEWLES